MSTILQIFIAVFLTITTIAQILVLYPETKRWKKRLLGAGLLGCVSVLGFTVWKELEAKSEKEIELSNTVKEMAQLLDHVNEIHFTIEFSIPSEANISSAYIARLQERLDFEMELLNEKNFPDPIGALAVILRPSGLLRVNHILPPHAPSLGEIKLAFVIEEGTELAPSNSQSESQLASALEHHTTLITFSRSERGAWHPRAPEGKFFDVWTLPSEIFSSKMSRALVYLPESKSLLYYIQLSVNTLHAPEPFLTFSDFSSSEVWISVPPTISFDASTHAVVASGMTGNEALFPFLTRVEIRFPRARRLSFQPDSNLDVRRGPFGQIAYVGRVSRSSVGERRAVPHDR